MPSSRLSSSSTAVFLLFREPLPEGRKPLYILFAFFLPLIYGMFVNYEVGVSCAAGSFMWGEALGKGSLSAPAPRESL